MTRESSALAPTAPPHASWLRRVGAAAALLLLVSPFWRRSWLHRAARLGVFAGYVYFGALFVLLAMEDRFLYHPTTPAEAWLPPPAGVRVEDVVLTCADGTPIHAWWGAPDGWTPERGAVLHCHGNDGNVSQWGQVIPTWQGRLKTGVLVFDYPGYGKSGGSPTEAGCYAAADAAYDWLTREKQVPAERVLLLGESLGTAIATDLASRRPCRALVLCSPFTSFPDVAQDKYPIFPGRWLVHNQFDSRRKIAGCRCPVFIAHGTADTVVPFAHGERLYAAAPEPKRFLAMPGHTHDDGPDDAFFDALRRFLDETAPAADPAH